MAEIGGRVIDNLDCEGEEGERGERGKRGRRGERGRRGHDGRDGATGSTGPAAPASGGLLKFSGIAGVSSNGEPRISFLADAGFGLTTSSDASPSYPNAIPRNLRNLATNLRFFTLQPGQSVLIELIKNFNTVPVVLASIPYGGVNPTTGIQSVLFGPAPFAIGDTLDLVVTVTGVLDVTGLFLSAIVGVE